MAIEQHACVTVSCDGCKAPYGDDETGGSWHFATVELAAADAAELRKDYGDGEEQREVHGWVIESDGRAKCENCRQKAYCAQNGHTPREHAAWRNPHTGVVTPAWVSCDVCQRRVR